MENSFIKKEKISVGATLIELILVVAIVAILAAPIGAIGGNFLSRNSLQNSVNDIASAFRTAQIYAMNGKEDSKWGVSITGNVLTIFKGDTYSARDSTFDETSNISNRITVSSAEVVFDKLTGNPNSTQNISVSNEAGENHSITVNEIGIVDVN